MLSTLANNTFRIHIDNRTVHVYSSTKDFEPWRQTIAFKQRPPWRISDHGNSKAPRSRTYATPRVSQSVDRYVEFTISCHCIICSESRYCYKCNGIVLVILHDLLIRCAFDRNHFKTFPLMPMNKRLAFKRFFNLMKS